MTLPILNKENIAFTNDEVLIKDAHKLLSLPVKVLQFGTGVLLRGLPDYFIDQANKAGVFNGRVVMVKSTDRGNDVVQFQQQNFLYTHCIQGYKQGILADETVVNTSISNILAASSQWAEVLKLAANPDVQIIISNTTESGLQLDEHDAWSDMPPTSFPAKLLAVLWHRYQSCGGSLEGGFVILPTELVPQNGKVLKALLMQLVEKFSLDAKFVAWMQEANHFCNTLVDRIVPGKMPQSAHQEKEVTLGYADSLMIMSEPYSLWAIEAHHPDVKKVLSFAAVNPGVVITPDINWYVEQKLRLLNGTHTFITGLAILSGFTTVKEAMANATFNSFTEALMKEEIVPCIGKNDDQYAQATQFANDVLDRFSNPFLDHRWQSIALNYSGKMKMRNLPLLSWWKERGIVPQRMVKGFAAYMLLLQTKLVNGKQTGSLLGQHWYLDDPYAAACAAVWDEKNIDEGIESLVSMHDLWGDILWQWPAFVDEVKQAAQYIAAHGTEAVLASKQIAENPTNG